MTKITNVINTLVDPIDVLFFSVINMLLFLAVICIAPTQVKFVVTFRVKHDCTS